MAFLHINWLFDHRSSRLFLLRLRPSARQDILSTVAPQVARRVVMLLVVVVVKEELLGVSGWAVDCFLDVEHVARGAVLLIGTDFMTDQTFDLGGDQMG